MTDNKVQRMQKNVQGAIGAIQANYHDSQSVASSPLVTHDQSEKLQHHSRERDKQRIQMKDRVKKWHFFLVIFIIAFTSYHIYDTTVRKLNDSRNLQRAFNMYLLQHDSLEIYWYGYRVGQQLINYPIQEYYFLQDVSDFLGRFEHMLSNLQHYIYGKIDQTTFNYTVQHYELRNFAGDGYILQWNVHQGLQSILNTTDIHQIKQLLIQYDRIILTVTDQPNQYQWKLTVFIQTFQNTSFYVTVLLQKQIDLQLSHICMFMLGCLLAASIYLQIKVNKKTQVQDDMNRKSMISRQSKKKKVKKSNMTAKIVVSQIGIQSMPDIMLCFLLLYTSSSYLMGVLSTHYTLILDGVTSFVAYLYLLKLFTHDDDYHISFLIKKSYIYVGRMFISFGPIFVGFVLFAHAIFCRYADLFVSFHKSFISLFCISYYNLTYEGYRSTEKSNPISAIFFTVFVLLFTICVYSGMLVSVFCSYVWNKRDEKQKQQLIKSLKVQCTNCSHSYMYLQGIKISEFEEKLIEKDGFIQRLGKNLKNSYCKAKYKQIILYRIKVLRQLIMENYIEDIKYWIDEEIDEMDISTIRSMLEKKDRNTMRQNSKVYGENFINFYEGLQQSVKKVRDMRNLLGSMVAKHQQQRQSNSPKSATIKNILPNGINSTDKKRV